MAGAKKGVKMFFRSDDPVSDAYRHDMEMEVELEKRPECCSCGEHIQDEYLYDIDGNLYCEDCIEDFKKEVDNYVKHEDDDF